MLRFAVLAERCRSAMPTGWRVLFVVLAVAALLAVTVAPALAGEPATNPFRWK